MTMTIFMKMIIITMTMIVLMRTVVIMTTKIVMTMSRNRTILIAEERIMYGHLVRL